eukprot:g4480.t1
MIDRPWSYIKSTGAVSGGQYQGTGPFGKGLCSDFSLPHCHHHGPQGKDPYPAEGKPGCPSESSPAGPTKCDATAKAPHNDFKQDKYSYKGKTQTTSGEKAIQQMIMQGGPVETAFTVYSDFELYTHGIYHHVSGSEAGGHAVRMVGWGVDNGVKYWKIANSWNPYWGEKGFFRIRRGTNEGGLGLFTTKALEEGEELFEEDPVCGMALLMFDQPNGRRHCQHCMRFLPETLEGGTSVCCAAGCGAFYCTKACREEAWAHHSVLCGANECWANFEQEARECCNEYYILAARALASLRADTLEEDLWEQSPWSGYASPAWWETMKRPKYEEPWFELISNHFKWDSDSESSASHGESSSADLDSEDEASLDRFFQSTVRDQTCDMGQKLLSVLEGQVSSLAEALLRAGPEPLGRLMGLLRVNAMALHAFRQVGEDEDQDLARGMAIYSLTSAMNHDGEANCFVSSDPDMPQRCLVRTLRRVEPEEELCIDYLQGSPYTTEQRCQVLLQQYGRLMVQHLDSLICAGQAKVRAWALVGRHAQKLRTVAASCRTSPTTLVAEGDAVEEVVRQAFVVIAAAGPYALCGEAVVRACVRSSTHYAFWPASTHSEEVTSRGKKVE